VIDIEQQLSGCVADKDAKEAPTTEERFPELVELMARL